MVKVEPTAMLENTLLFYFTAEETKQAQSGQATCPKIYSFISAKARLKTQALHPGLGDLPRHDFSNGLSV